MGPNTPSAVLGKLLTEAEKKYKQSQKVNAVKSILTLYQPGKANTSNVSKLSTATRDVLDEFSTFIGISKLYTKGNKAFRTKDKLVKRIVQELRVLQEASKCLECGDAYTFQRGRQELLRCFLCEQPSHDCEMIRGIIESRCGDMARYLTSEVWLCSACFTPRAEEASCNVSVGGTPASKNAVSRIMTNSPMTPRTPRACQTDSSTNASHNTTSDCSMQFPSPKDIEKALREAAEEGKAGRGNVTVGGEDEEWHSMDGNQSESEKKVEEAEETEEDKPKGEEPAEERAEEDEDDELEEGEIKEVGDPDGLQELISELKKVEKEQREDEKFPNRCEKTCIMFRHGTCPHGLGGKRPANGLEKCRYYHPKICTKFNRHGDGANGCNAGDDCDKLHKILCPAAVETAECSDITCHLLHTLGTKLPPRKEPVQARQSKVRPDTDEHNQDAGKSYRRDRAAQAESGNLRWRTQDTSQREARRGRTISGERPGMRRPARDQRPNGGQDRSRVASDQRGQGRTSPNRRERAISGGRQGMRRPVRDQRPNRGQERSRPASDQRGRDRIRSNGNREPARGPSDRKPGNGPGRSSGPSRTNWPNPRWARSHSRGRNPPRSRADPNSNGYQKRGPGHRWRHWDDPPETWDHVRRDWRDDQEARGPRGGYKYNEHFLARGSIHQRMGKMEQMIQELMMTNQEMRREMEQKRWRDGTMYARDTFSSRRNRRVDYY